MIRILAAAMRKRRGKKTKITQIKAIRVVQKLAVRGQRKLKEE